MTEKIDVSSAGGKLIFGIFESLAEVERSLIQERVSAGLVAAKKRGRFGGPLRTLDEGQIKIARSMRIDHSLSIISKHFGG